MSGGTVYTETVVFAAPEQFVADAPYQLAIISRAEGGKHPSAAKILLDPAGRALDSAAFTSLIEKAEREGRDMAFVVGGADGFSEAWKSRADLLLALSPMTLPHELARVVLAEQIYRAFATLRGHPYPR